MELGTMQSNLTDFGSDDTHDTTAHPDVPETDGYWVDDNFTGSNGRYNY